MQHWTQDIKQKTNNIKQTNKQTNKQKQKHTTLKTRTPPKSPV
jgi:hypothetical protein